MKSSDRYHKSVEWSSEDGVVEDVIQHFEKSGRRPPKPRVKPMLEMA